ncbi:MAG: outer membrane protein transport protein [Bacteriovoracaceae bacterium]|nr:outer membrane protein transport protein [Bacteriovoracaceae bacterium]
MRRLLLFIAVVSLFSSFAHATNGDNMIAVGAKARAMGGTGIAEPMGTESALKNPALLTYAKGFNFTFAGSAFMPNVKAKNGAAGEKESSADLFLIPAIGFTNQLSRNLFFGLGAYGTSGLGIDYRDTAAADDLMKMGTSMTIMKFVPSLAYKMDSFSFGLGLAIMYGNLSVAYDRNITIQTAPMTGSAVGFEGGGSSSDLGFGFNLGVGYKWNDLKFGAMYQSTIKMEYKHILANAANDDFGTTGITDKVAQPAEYGFGVAYTLGDLTGTFDFKQVLWNSAEGFEDFKWEDQSVFAVGLAYKLDKKCTLRAGFNHGKHPLQAGAIGSANNSLNQLNLEGFPATAESHITVGVGHQFTKKFKLDGAFVYALEVEENATVGSTSTNLVVKHSQMGFTLAGSWHF